MILSEKVAILEYQNDKLFELIGEIFATYEFNEKRPESSELKLYDPRLKDFMGSYKKRLEDLKKQRL